MLVPAEAGGDTVISLGLLRKRSARRRISGGMVAEKNSVWRIGGSRPTMRSTSGMKPMSSMRSASSITRILTSFSRMLAALEEVEQAARRGDQHVDAALERALLVVEAHAADQQRHVELVVLAVDLEVLGHLGGQLARRLQDQRARHARLGAALGQDVDHRQDEGGGLAGAGLGASEDVAAHQDDGDGLFLDRGGRRCSPCRRLPAVPGRSAPNSQNSFNFRDLVHFSAGLWSGLIRP